MSNLGLFGLSLLGLTIGGADGGHQVSLGRAMGMEYAVLAAMVVGIGIAVAMTPVVIG